MKMVKSLLLGTAAGIAAFGGAQAADLPVKAKPVEYVKVCSLYGAGFWYVPGTDTCLKIGSYIRSQTEFNGGNGGIPLGTDPGNLTAGRNDRVDTSQLSFRNRAAISVDLRTQTEYGTLRSYLETGGQVSTTGLASAGANAATADAVFIDRAFVQFAGFTVGRYRSFFDINSFAPYNYSNSRLSPDTGATGIYGAAYTAQLGNGFTATLAFEDPGVAAGSGRGRSTLNLSPSFTNSATSGALNGTPFFNNVTGTLATNNAGVTFPDVVGAIRVDQAWGYAQIAGALHDASGGYYQSSPVVGVANATAGHPGTTLGWAMTAGFTLKDVGGLKGDSLGFQYAYTQGAAGYATRNVGANQVYGAGNDFALSFITDGVFTNNAGVELTTVQSYGAFYEHLWTPKWKTSIYGGYLRVDYNQNANAMFCGTGGTPSGFGLNGVQAAATGTQVAAVGLNVQNCNPNNSLWQAGTRTQWNPHPDLDIGLDFLYTHVNTAFAGNALVGTAGTVPSALPAGGRPGGQYSISDQDIFTVMFRVQRNFLP